MTVFHRVDGLVISIEFDRRIASLETATDAMTTLRPLTDDEREPREFAY